MAGSVLACGGNGASLNVGDCVNFTSGADANGDPIGSTVVVDCAVAHDEEVFSVFNYPNAAAFPGYEAIGALQQTQCEADFKAYVGIAWDQSAYVINYDSPTAATWSTGDTRIVCLLVDGNGGQLTGSARGTAR